MSAFPSLCSELAVSHIKVFCALRMFRENIPLARFHQSTMLVSIQSSNTFVYSDARALRHTASLFWGLTHRIFKIFRCPTFSSRDHPPATFFYCAGFYTLERKPVQIGRQRVASLLFNSHHDRIGIDECSARYQTCHSGGG